MDFEPCPCAETSETTTTEKPVEDISESINIIQENKNFILNVKIRDNSMTLDIKENNSLINTCYIRKMSLDDIKEMHKAFYGLNSCSEFLDYLKQLIENKKLFIKENEENISIDLEILYLFKRSTVEISLVQEKINSEEVVKSIIKELLLIKEQIKDLNKQTNETIESNNKEEIIKIKEEISNRKIN